MADPLSGVRGLMSGAISLVLDQSFTAWALGAGGVAFIFALFTGVAVVGVASIYRSVACRDRRGIIALVLNCWGYRQCAISTLRRGVSEARPAALSLLRAE
jgi:hypothetical protein